MTDEFFEETADTWPTDKPITLAGRTLKPLLTPMKNIRTVAQIRIPKTNQLMTRPGDRQPVIIKRAARTRIYYPTDASMRRLNAILESDSCSQDYQTEYQFRAPLRG
jgi:hypothetical protein